MEPGIPEGQLFTRRISKELIVESEDPGEDAREHYRSIAERMSRNSTPCSTHGRTPPPQAMFGWEAEDAELELDWPGDEEMSSHEEAEVRSVMRQIGQSGIRLLAIDNDLTLISIHTGGHWPGTAEELAEQARPIFKIIIEEAIQLRLYIAIVTFSSQPALIREMLTHMVDSHIDTSQIIVHGGLLKVKDADGQELKPCPEVRERYQGTGKQEHIACSVQHLEGKYNLRINPDEVLMMDDDVKNLEEAKRHGIRALLFDPIEPFSLVEQIGELL
eukprot:TRINITY_DN14145_c0_g1_i3.p1 TRINITY_DN14145_c0_g1~~TRINITY_DN14145_c0_g1_i3.p1  ORF type:complete len:274 (-),score=29.92 TRINITY_DN14145_c0_g1_i3:34-855(-)